jgi:uncharacterized membrane protein YhaH (DUF805 family)
MNALASKLRAAFSFHRRASFQDLHHGIIVIVVSSIILSILNIFYVLSTNAGFDPVSKNIKMIVVSLILEAMLICILAFLVRRAHDQGMSGWWVSIGFPPFLGIPAVALAEYEARSDGLIFCAAMGAMAYFIYRCMNFLLRPGEPGPNEYGPDPLSSDRL